MISPGDMLVGENDIVTSVIFPSNYEIFDSSAKLEVEGAVPRGPVYRSILKRVE